MWLLGVSPGKCRNVVLSCECLAEDLMALVIHVLFQTQRGKKVPLMRPVQMQKTPTLLKLLLKYPMLDFTTWVWQQFIKCLSSCQWPLQHRHSPTVYTFYTHTPLCILKAVCKSSKPAEQDCLHFYNLLTKYLSNLLLQVWGFCLPGFNET